MLYTLDFQPGALQKQAAFYQQYLIGKMRTLRLDEAHQSILSSLTVGYRSDMPREITNQFAVTGVIHLLSVSGFHVAIVASFISFLLRFFAGNSFFRWLRFLLTILVVWLFAYITGLSVPTVRAAVMVSVFLTGRMLGRTTDGYNTLAATAFCMLVYHPFSLLDIGFQLSFVSVFFLLYLQPKIVSIITVRNPLLAAPWNALAVTLAAQIGTVFLCCFYFGRISTVFIFTNLPLAFVAASLIPLALLWMLLPMTLPGYIWLQSVVEALTKALFKIVDAFSRVPGADLSVRFDLFMLIVSYLSLFLFLSYFKTKSPLCLIISLGSLLVLLLYSCFFL